MNSADFAFGGCFQTLESKPVLALVKFADVFWRLYKMNYKIKHNYLNICPLEENVLAPTVFELKLDTRYSITAGDSDLRPNCFRAYGSQTADYGKCTTEIFYPKYHCTPKKGHGTLEFGYGSIV